MDDVGSGSEPTRSPIRRHTACRDYRRHAGAHAHLRPYQREACLNDALIFLIAAKRGVPLLAANETSPIDSAARAQGHFVHY